MKKLLALLTAAALSLSLPLTTAARDTTFEETIASDLKSLGLFKGVSETDFDLNREPSRVEALVILIRVLGKEQDALGGYWYHPFTDVPSWADSYIGYAYQNGLTNGVSETEFGAGNAGAGTFLTFVLRALGYSDANGEDFSWQDPYTLAESVGILPDCVNTDEFWRSDVALVSYAALGANLKNSAETLAEKLITAGVFTEYQFDSCYDAYALSSFDPVYYDWDSSYDTLFTQDDVVYDEYSYTEPDEYFHEDPYYTDWNPYVTEDSGDSWQTGDTGIYEDTYTGYVYDGISSSMTADKIEQLEGVAVFWAPTGNKIHLEHDCRSFKLGVAYAGTLWEAQNVRTEGWCGYCAKYQSSSTYSSNYDATAEVLAGCYTYDDYLNGIPYYVFQ